MAAAVLSVSFAAWAAQESLDELLHFSGKRQEAAVAKVTVSDRLILKDGRTVKLIGIESAGKPPRKEVEYDINGTVIEEPQQEPDMPLEEEAVVYARRLLQGKSVKLEYDVEARDQDGHPLVYVFLPDGTLANAELLRQGFVHLKIRPPNLKYAQQLREAYKEAKAEQRGFMSH